MMTEDLIYTGKTWRGLNKLEGRQLNTEEEEGERYNGKNHSGS
jgi:hypothetical protein